MNYDLCVLLNRILENAYDHLDEFPNKSITKNQDYVDNFFEQMNPELYLTTLEDPSVDHQVYSFWLYRNGKISKQLSDFETSAKRIVKELANLSYSNNPVLDLLYFSGVIKISLSLNKAIVVECCIRPSLDQMLTLKDLERKILPNNGVSIWRIYERKGKNNFYEDFDLEKLHSFKWSKIK